MFLLDTNICIALLKADPRAVSRFNLCADECYVSTIVAAELYKGVYYSQKQEKNLEYLNLFLGDMPIVSFDRSAAAEFGKIQGELKRIGRPTGETDAFIAAVARSRGDTLVTNNLRHFSNISGLQLENWLDEEK